MDLVEAHKAVLLSIFDSFSKSLCSSGAQPDQNGALDAAIAVYEKLSTGDIMKMYRELNKDRLDGPRDDLQLRMSQIQIDHAERPETAALLEYPTPRSPEQENIVAKIDGKFFESDSDTCYSYAGEADDDDRFYGYCKDSDHSCDNCGGSNCDRNSGCVNFNYYSD